MNGNISNKNEPNINKGKLYFEFSFSNVCFIIEHRMRLKNINIRKFIYIQKTREKDTSKT